MNPDADQTAFESRWTSRKLKNLDAFHWQVGHTAVWVQRMDDDWLVAGETGRKEKGRFFLEPATHVPLGVPWRRWAGLDGASAVSFSPVFPDLPLVVKTRAAVMVPPEKTISLYMNLPVWVEVKVDARPDPEVLGVFPTRTLSNTWFGNLFEGELCYALKSLATRSTADIPAEPLAATCCFSIYNHSGEPLLLDRIRILSRHLSIHKNRRRLWASLVKVTTYDTGQPSHLEYPEQPPEEARAGELVRPAEEVYRTRFFKESLAHYTRALLE